MVIMEDEKFVYVFSKEARDDMIRRGYVLISGDDGSGRYIFENNPALNFGLVKTKAVKSNTLTF